MANLSTLFIHEERVDLADKLCRKSIGLVMAAGDSQANRFTVALYRNGEPVDIAGNTVMGYFIRPRGETIVLSGKAESNKASIDLPENCYYYEGSFSLAIKITTTGTAQTVLILDGRIARTRTDSIIDTEDVIPSLEDLLAQIDTIEEATRRANEAADAAAEFVGLTVKATTLPTGSAATATFANGVLTLGLPRGEKGATGSSSPIKVNGIEGVGDNITLTADDVPMGSMPVANAVRMAGAKSILVNGDFANPVNQRSQTEYTVNGYTIDRWRTKSDAAAVTIVEGGITAGVALRQYIDADTSGMLTLAVCDSNGAISCVAGNLADGAIVGDKMQLATDSSGVYFLLNAGHTYRWAALYRGSYTVDNLPNFVSKGYAAELLECQRYYIRMKSYHVSGQTLTTGLRVGFTLPAAMRITPTLTMINAGTVIALGTKDVAVTGANVNAMNGNRIQIFTTFASTSGWSNQTGTWLNGEFELSADL